VASGFERAWTSIPKLPVSGTRQRTANRPSRPALVTSLAFPISTTMRRSAPAGLTVPRTFTVRPGSVWRSETLVTVRERTSIRSEPVSVSSGDDAGTGSPAGAPGSDVGAGAAASSARQWPFRRGVTRTA
jgi:hypothetical protein